MEIDKHKCVGCGNCHTVCTMGAIYVGVSSKCLPDGSAPHEEWVRKAGDCLSPNAKTNLGLGGPCGFVFSVVRAVYMKRGI
jgi:Fe-S-cluster-containing hydrogenase component 2